MEAFDEDDRDGDDREQRAKIRKLGKEMKANRRKKRTDAHEDARFDVISFGPGGVVPAFSFKEAVKIAKRSKAKHVEVYERDECVFVLHKN